MSGTDPWAGFTLAANAQSDPWAEFAPVSKPAESPQPLSWLDVPGEAIANAAPSAGHLVEGIYSAVRHPIKTGEAIGATLVGERDKLRQALGQAPGPEETPADAARSAQAADAVNGYFGNRYGSLEGFKNALATDPVGVAADASTLLGGAEGIGGELPGIAGQAARTAGDVGRAVNPVNVGTSIIGKAAKAAAPAFETAAKAPTISALRDAARAAYQTADNSGIAVNGDAFNTMVNDLGTALADKMIDRGLHPQSVTVLNRLQGEAANVAPPSAEDLQAVKDAAAASERATAKVKRLGQARMNDQRVQPALNGAIAEQQQAASNLKTLQQNILTPKTVSLPQLDRLRRLAGYATDSPNQADRFMGRIIKDHIDDFVNNLGPDQLAGNPDPAAVDALNNARDYWARASKGEVIQRAFDKTANRPPAQSEAAALRTQFRNIANNPRAMGRFSPGEQQAILQVVRGGPVEKVLRGAGLFAPNSLGGLGRSALAMGMSAMLGEPAAAFVIPAIGEGADLLAQRMTLRNAQRTSEMVRGAPMLPPQPTRMSSMLNTLGDRANAAEGGLIPRAATMAYEANVPAYLTSGLLPPAQPQQSLIPQ